MRRTFRAARAALHHGLCAGLLLLAVPALAADRAVTLTMQADLKPGLAAMPQIAAPADEAERRINAALRRLDGSVRKAAAACKAEGGAQSSWERGIQVPMRGPRFLSLVIVDNAFCGGAHPNVGTMSIVYDLTTGTPVDWTALLPASLTGTVALGTGMDGTRMVTLASKALHALYLKGYRPCSNPKPGGDDAECREAVTDAGSGAPPPMMAWLDAKAGGLAVAFDLSHAVQACADTVVIPATALRRAGAKAVLVDALDAAHGAP